jgi:hypothetical protein
VCRPLHRGGLGISISGLERLGRALRLRWLWFKWKDPDKPWCDLELPVDEVDEALFAAATKVSIHSGNKSSWLQGCAPATMFPALFNHTRKKNRSVAEVISNEKWIKDIMHHMTPSLFLDHVRLWHLVSSFPFDQTDQDEDEIIWSRTANGAYSAKSAYNMQFDGGLDSEFPKAIWQVWAPNRCKFFLWLLLQNRVWAADRLMLREWPNQYFCPLCIRNLETVDHLVKECPVSCDSYGLRLAIGAGCQAFTRAAGRKN